MLSVRPTETSVTGVRFAPGPTRSALRSNPPPYPPAPPPPRLLVQLGPSPLQPTVAETRAELPNGGTVMRVERFIKQHLRGSWRHRPMRRLTCTPKRDGQQHGHNGNRQPPEWPGN